MSIIPVPYLPTTTESSSKTRTSRQRKWLKKYHDNIVTSDNDVIIDLDDNEEEKNVSQ